MVFGAAKVGGLARLSVAMWRKESVAETFYTSSVNADVAENEWFNTKSLAVLF